MFRHQGKARTVKHNIQIAVVLSFVAGIVNITGFLAITELTTNVTGHFALFIFDVDKYQVWEGTIYLIYILAFLLGSFTSGFLIENFKTNKKLNVYVIPTALEITIIIGITLFYHYTGLKYPPVIASALLFAMGLQNSFVTKISDAVVRTTHLTGLFTDLGIELSYLFFKKEHPNVAHLKANIQLRIYIISFFFFGGLVAGFFYTELGLEFYTLILAAIVLVASLLFDEFRFQYVNAKNRNS